MLCRGLVLYLVESKKVVMVGIPGVGKSTLVSTVVEKLKNKNHSVSVHSFGTIMLDEAKKNGILDRDQLRKQPIKNQQEYQKFAAEKLAQITNEVVLIDTHAFISTPPDFTLAYLTM